jgi:hypothetical protein
LEEASSASLVSARHPKLHALDTLLTEHFSRMERGGRIGDTRVRASSLNGNGNAYLQA